MLIGEVARRSGVSARMLRHYDRIGLVTPAERTSGDYRRYTAADIERLFHVESLRTLGFSLAEIANILEAEDFAPAELVTRLAERMRVKLEATTELLARIERVRSSEPRNWSDILRVIELIRGFDAASASDRQRAALALEEVDERDTTVLIDALLREDEPNTAGALLWALARTGDAAIPALADALDSTQRQRRHRALEALVKIGTPTSLRVVAAQTGHNDELVRARATITAGASGDVSVIAALVALVASGDLDMEAGDALEALAKDDVTIRAIAQKASEAITDTDADGRRRLAGMLATIPGPDIDSTLHTLAADPDPSVEITARAHLAARSGRR
ncbi:MerR family transcriptional regulator [Agromyces silvae]|uniref:MerR family transcriptional regulator n=1 Tax=Agromyces silvae TaxID=3388266 RepID=UPI00280C15A0|nr:MerR family transcriptional regulator [Agromyces protaetiae]